MPSLSIARAALRGGVTRQAAPFAHYASNPVGFFSDVLGIEPWGRHPALPPEQGSQVDILEAIRDYDKVAVRSGHKVSKSLSAAGIALWWVMTQTDGRVTLTAPANHQVESILWSEVRLLHTGKHPGSRRVAKKLPGQLYIDCRSGLVLGDGWGVWGLTTNEPERMSGKSGSKQLYIVDEASGYPEDIYTSIFGNLAGGGKALFISNPTRTAGTFYDIFHGKSEGWKKIWISSTNTPNFHPEVTRIDGLADPSWEAWAREHWGGEGHPLYDMRVLGKFPSQAANSVVSIDLVEAAVARWPEASADGELDVGVDVARGGEDDPVVCAVRGLKCLEIGVVKLDRRVDAMPLGHQVGEAAAQMALRLSLDDDRFRPRVKVDVIGVGASVVDYLLEHYRERLEIVPVNVGSAADAEVIVVPSVDNKPALSARDVYKNLRAQVWFDVAAWLRRGGSLPNDDKLRSELVAPTYKYVERSKIQVEGKDDLKKTLKRSPDRADALGLAVYDPPESGGGVSAMLIG